MKYPVMPYYALFITIYLRAIDCRHLISHNIKSVFVRLIGRTAASMYSLDTSLTKAGGTFAWSKALKDKLEELRKTQWIDLLQQQVDSLFPPLGENIASDRRDGTSKRLVDVVSRMLETFGDPYAQYYPPEEWSEINDVAAGRDVVGIGVAFAQDTARGRGAAPEVVSVVPKSPAAEKGVRVSDRLVEVDGKRVRTPSDAARWIPGLPGTIANVKFQRSMPWAPPVASWQLMLREIVSKELHLIANIMEDVGSTYG